MTILETSKEFTKREQFLMTKSNSILSVKDVADGEELKVTGYLIFEDTNSKGEVTNILSILGENKGFEVVWSCQSQTFKDMFFDIYTIFDGADFTIRKTSGKSKAGREFVTCDLV